MLPENNTNVPLSQRSSL